MSLISCERRAVEPAQSLVGSKSLPSLADLHKETIALARMGGKDGKDTLTIEIRPTNEIVVSHFRGQDKTPVAQETGHLSGQQGESIRRMLWRVRPDYGAPAQKTIPLGCHYVYDAGYDWAVAYVRGDKPANFVIFTLPYREYCQTAAYAQARDLIGAVLGALPRSNVIQGFPPGRFHPLGTYS